VDELTMETRQPSCGVWKLAVGHPEGFGVSLRALLYSRYQINQFYSANSPSASTHGKFQPDSRPKSCARDTGVRPM